MGTMHLEFLEKVDLRRVFLVSAPEFHKERELLSPPRGLTETSVEG
jgi:hypothetical protein